MKLQYLGDSRDSFKWDLLHFAVTNTNLTRLYYVPWLTPNDPVPIHGNMQPNRFPCRQEILEFNRRLRVAKDLSMIGELGKISGLGSFDVHLFHPERYVEPGPDRNRYLSDFAPETLRGTLVFLDPDNGFETTTQRGVKWVRYQEIEAVLKRVPEDSAIVVYQHRPMRTWDDILREIRSKCAFSPFFMAIIESNLSFIFLSKDNRTFQTLSESIEAYARSKNGRVSIYR